MELQEQTKKVETLEERQKSIMYRSCNALRKKVARANARKAKALEDASASVQSPRRYTLKDRTGTIRSEIRVMFRKLAGEGVAAGRAESVIKSVADGLGIEVEGSFSPQIVGRIMYEGLMEAQTRIAHELKKAKCEYSNLEIRLSIEYTHEPCTAITIFGDGTSIKNQQHQSHYSWCHDPLSICTMC